MNRILVPVDGSKSSNDAARFAGQLARDTGAAVTLLHVYDLPSVAAMGLRHVAEPELSRIRDAMARGSFDQARAAMGEVPRIDEHLDMGHPAQEICSYANREKPDLVVMGSRGLSELKSLLLGSVSEYVVRHAGCPVTIVR